MHRVIRGIFGFSIVIVPIILLITAYYTEKREGMSLSRRLLFSAGLTVLVSSFFQIMFIGDIGKKGFFRAIGYLYTTAADDAFQSGGVISAVLAYPFLRIIGTPGAQIIIALLLFVAIMWMLDMSMQQLWYYICWPFRKLRELWNKEPDWADDIPDTDISGEPELPQAEEPEFLLPEQTRTETGKGPPQGQPSCRTSSRTGGRRQPGICHPRFCRGQLAAFPGSGRYDTGQLQPAPGQCALYPGV